MLLSTLGPDSWCAHWPVAREGKRQSPVDINTHAVATDSALNKNELEWTYHPEDVTEIENTGASFKLNVVGQSE